MADSLRCIPVSNNNDDNSSKYYLEDADAEDQEDFKSQAFCLPSSYSKQDRPNVFSSDILQVKTGFIVDDVTDVNDDSCAVTMVLVMRFHWEEKRMRINETIFNKRLKPGEQRLEMHYESKASLWIPDLYVSNMETLTNNGFLDHPGVKLDIGRDKNIYYSRYAQVLRYMVALSFLFGAFKDS